MKTARSFWVPIVASASLLGGGLIAPDPGAALSSDPASQRGMWLGSRPVEFETIDKGIVGPWTKPALLLIRDPSEWARAMVRAGAVISVPPPRIDWSRKAIVLAVLGEQPVLGYRIEVSQALRHAQDLLLKVHIQLPDGPNYTQNFSYPYHIVAVDTWKSMGLEAQFDAVVPDLDNSQPAPPHGKEKLDRSAAGNPGDQRQTTWGDLKSRVN